MFDRVFVTVGTTSFEKLVELVVSDKAVDQFCKWSVKDVIIQGGDKGTVRVKNELKEKGIKFQINACEPSTKVDDTKVTNVIKWKERGINFQFYDYKSSILADMKWADLIICHAGAGTTIEGLDLGKILIVVPNETLMDNHQMELADKLGEENYAFRATIDTFFTRLLDVDVSEIKPFPRARPKRFNKYIKNSLFKENEEEDDFDEEEESEEEENDEEEETSLHHTN